MSTDTHAQMAQLPKQTISFFDLSAEIRNDIYHLCLHYPATIRINEDRPRIFRSRVRTELQGQLLRTCRQAHTEGSPVLYGSNSFDPGRRRFGASGFVRRIGNNIRHLRFVQFHSSYHHYYIDTTLLSLRKATALQFLRLDRKYFPDQKTLKEIWFGGLTTFLEYLCKEGRRKGDVIDMLRIGEEADELETSRSTLLALPPCVTPKYTTVNKEDRELGDRIRSRLDILLPEDDTRLIVRLKICCSRRKDNWRKWVLGKSG